MSNCTNVNTVKAARAAISAPAQPGEATCGSPPPSSWAEVTSTTRR